MFQEVIDQKAKRLLATLTKSGVIEDFYLAGGTALALQLGHRKSIDLDWFKQDSFNTDKLKKSLAKLGEIKVESEENDTLNLNLSGMKLSFLGYPYKMLFPALVWQNIKIVDYRDIACMKLDAISSRGSKKDFIDLYFILQSIAWQELFKLFAPKYKAIKYNKVHILKSLIYFVDADKEPIPIMLKDINWQKVKSYFKQVIKEEL